MLAVLGSTTAIAAEQARVAVNRSTIARFTLNSAELHADRRRREQEIARVTVSVSVAVAPVIAIDVRPQAAGVPPLDPARAAASLAAVVTGVLAAAPNVTGLYLSGGATARAVLDRLGATAILVEGEVLPLAARGRLLDGPHAGLTVVTKGGLIGGPDAVTRCIAALVHG